MKKGYLIVITVLVIVMIASVSWAEKPRKEASGVESSTSARTIVDEDPAESVAVANNRSSTRIEILDLGEKYEFRIFVDWQETCRIVITKPEFQADPAEFINFHNQNCNGVPEDVLFQVTFQLLEGMVYYSDGTKHPLAIFYENGLTASP